MRTQPLLKSGKSKQTNNQSEPNEYIVNKLLHLFTLSSKDDQRIVIHELMNRYPYLHYDLSCLSEDEYSSLSSKYIKFLIDVDKINNNLKLYFSGRFFKTIFCKNYLNFILPIFDLDLTDVSNQNRLLSCLKSLAHLITLMDDVDKTIVVSRIFKNLPRWREQREKNQDKSFFSFGFFSSDSNKKNEIVHGAKSILLYYFIYCQSDSYLDECAKALIPLDVDKPFLDYQLYLFDWKSLDKTRQQFLLRLTTLHLEHKNSEFIYAGLNNLRRISEQLNYDQYRLLLPALIKLIDLDIINLTLNSIYFGPPDISNNIKHYIFVSGTEFIRLLALFAPPEKSKWIIENTFSYDSKQENDDLIPWCNHFASDKNGIRYRGKPRVSETSHATAYQHHPRLSRHGKID